MHEKPILFQERTSHGRLRACHFWLECEKELRDHSGCDSKIRWAYRDTVAWVTDAELHCRLAKHLSLAEHLERVCKSEMSRI